MLEFETTMKGKYVNGVDIIRCNEAGRIVEFRVMIRPLQAVNLVHEQMAAMLEAMAPAGLGFSLGEISQHDVLVTAIARTFSTWPPSMMMSSPVMLVASCASRDDQLEEDEVGIALISSAVVKDSHPSAATMRRLSFGGCSSRRATALPSAAMESGSDTGNAHRLA